MNKSKKKKGKSGKKRKEKGYNNLPMVEMKVVLKASSENLKRTHVLPTPESPISNNLNK